MRYKVNLWGNVNADPVAYNNWQWDINHQSNIRRPELRIRSKEEMEAMEEINKRAFKRMRLRRKNERI